MFTSLIFLKKLAQYLLPLVAVLAKKLGYVQNQKWMAHWYAVFDVYTFKSRWSITKLSSTSCSQCVESWKRPKPLFWNVLNILASWSILKGIPMTSCLSVLPGAWRFQRLSPLGGPPVLSGVDGRNLRVRWLGCSHVLGPKGRPNKILLLFGNVFLTFV